MFILSSRSLKAFFCCLSLDVFVSWQLKQYQLESEKDRRGGKVTLFKVSAGNEE